MVKRSWFQVVLKSLTGHGSLARCLEIKDRYGQMVLKTRKNRPEGDEKSSYKVLLGVIHQLVGVWQSGMGYWGAKKYRRIATESKICAIRSQGLRGPVHDVSITKEVRIIVLKIRPENKKLLRQSRSVREN